MRLIDADALKFDIMCVYGSNPQYINWLNHAPTVDAVPVRHGKWENDGIGVLRCSECNEQAPWKYGMDYIDYRWKANYCPNCGARMDEE